MKPSNNIFEILKHGNYVLEDSKFIIFNIQVTVLSWKLSVYICDA